MCWHLILGLIIEITSHLLQGITIISCFKLKKYIRMNAINEAKGSKCSEQ